MCVLSVIPSFALATHTLPQTHLVFVSLSLYVVLTFQLNHRKILDGMFEVCKLIYSINILPV